MKPPFNNTYIKRDTTRDNRGKIQFNPNSGTAAPCHFREIFGLQEINGMEQQQGDAMLWTNPGEVAQDNIVFAGTKHYRVIKVTEARTLFSSAVQFTKCLLQVEKESNGS